MWVSVHCWTAVPADEHASCSQSALAPPGGHACEGTRHAQTMHLPQSSNVLQVEEATQTVHRLPTELHTRASNRTMDLHTCTHTHAHTPRGQYQSRMMWTIVHTRLPSPECDLHVTMSLYRNKGVWLLWPHKQNDDKHTHTHTHTQELTLLYREGEHPMHYGHNQLQSSRRISWSNVRPEDKLVPSVSDARRGLKCPSL